MDRWIGKVAVVTGASSGIGEAITIALLKHGVNVIGLSRRIERMKATAEELKDAKGTFHPVQCDVSKVEDLLEAFQFAETLGGVDIMVNCAGVCVKEPIIDGSIENFQAILDVNVKATAICIRESVQSMKKRNKPGHIININSILGHNASAVFSQISLYQSSKFAMTATSEVVRNELLSIKLPVKVTNLSPGLVKTDMPLKIAEHAEKMFQLVPHLEPKDVADSVLYVLGTPPNIEIKQLTITPLHEAPFIGSTVIF